MRWAALLLVSLYALAPVAAMATGSGSIASNGVAQLSGAKTILGTATGVEFQQPATPYTLEVEGADAYRIDVPLQVVTVSTQAGVLFENTQSLPQEHRGAVELPSAFDVAGTEQFSARILPRQAPLAIQVQATTISIQPVGEYWDQGTDEKFLFANDIAGGPVRPEGVAALLQSSPAAVSIDSPSTILIVGAQVTWPNGQLSMGRTSNVAQDPATGTQTGIVRLEVLVINATRILLTPGGAVELAATELAFEGVEQAHWSGVLAAADIDGTPLPNEAGLIELFGSFDVAANFTRPQAEWQFDGKIRAVKVDAGNWEAAGTTAAVAASLVVLVVLAKFAKGLLTLLLGRHTPRLMKAKALSPARQRIMALVHDLQPVTLNDIVERAGISPTNAAYHLRVLQSHDLLQTTRPAGHAKRNTLYMLNSGSLKAIVPIGDAQQTVQLDVAMGTVNSSPIRKAIFAGILREGSATYDQLAQHLHRQGFEIARSTATHHLQAMVAAGAIREHRSGRQKTYSITVEPNTTRAIQYRSFLVMHGLHEVFAAVHQGTWARVATRGEARKWNKAVQFMQDIGIFTPVNGTPQIAAWLQPVASAVAAPIGGQP